MCKFGIEAEALAKGFAELGYAASKSVNDLPAEVRCEAPAETVPDNTAMAAMIREILSPVMQTMAQFMAQSTEALNRVAAAQKIQADRMEALEREIRLNTLVTPAQVRLMNDAIRRRARELLADKSLEDDKKAVNQLCAIIRRDVNTRYGISALHEVPKHEYPVVLTMANGWLNVLCLRDVVKEARRRNENNA